MSFKTFFIWVLISLYQGESNNSLKWILLLHIYISNRQILKFKSMKLWFKFEVIDSILYTLGWWYIVVS